MSQPHDPQTGRTLLDSFTAPRFCDVAFPAYRFTPGVNPHPTAHPDGHSHEGPDFAHPQVRVIAPEQWGSSVEYLYGCDLYNHAYWWEAHEAWEALWKAIDKSSVQRKFLQGLIQTSACHLKRFVGHADGVARLRKSSLDYLRRAADEICEPVYMGLDLPAFISQVERYHAVLAGGAGRHGQHDAALYPYILLRTDS